MFTILNLLVITSIIVLGLLMADGKNWTDEPGFFPMGYQGVRSITIANVHPKQEILSVKVYLSVHEWFIYGPYIF